ncbi:unnamed protein product [Discula destructiva]
MGRTEPSIGRPPAAFRRDVRAKQARATLNKIIPSMLSAHPRARRGIEASELIVSPPAQPAQSRQPASQDSAPLESGQAPAGPRLTIHATDTLTAARSLLSNTSNSIKKVAILNMASPLSAGGGFLNGATSQEEFLCMRTTIITALRDEFYRLPEVGCVYSPSVLVFRSGADGQDAVLNKNDRWFVDIVSAGMLRLPDTEIDEETGQGEFVHAQDRELVIEKMRAVMRVLQQKGVAKVVLGAWGCGGAYCNPLGEIARAWRRVLVGQKKTRAKRKGGANGQIEESWRNLEQVLFAIKDQNMAEAFQAAFGDELEWVEEAEADLTDGEDHVREQGEAEKLVGRISELKIRIDRTSDVHLKERLEAVMTRLQSQIPEESGGHATQTEEIENGGETSEDQDEASEESRGDEASEEEEEKEEGDQSAEEGEEDEEKGEGIEWRR